MLKYNFSQQIRQPTTDYGLMLDHVYHNMTNVKDNYSVFDAYYTDHDKVIADFKV